MSYIADHIVLQSQSKPSRATVKFNVNDYVRVKLTDSGREIHRQNHDDLFAHIQERTGRAPTFPYSPPKEDADGWSEWQLWSLMQEFGQRIGMGFTPPFETTIEFVARSHS